MVARSSGLHSRLSSSLGTQLLGGFAWTVAAAFLAALVSLVAVKDATDQLDSLQATQRRLSSAINDLEVAAALESVPAYLASGRPRNLDDRARGQALFTQALDTLTSLTAADDGLDLLDAIQQARRRSESTAASQVALYDQGWQRSATYLWLTEGQDARQQLEQQIGAYRSWYETAVKADVAAAQVRARVALFVSIGLIAAAALGGLVVGGRLTRSITRRLSTLTAAARAIAEDDFTARAAVPGTDEVAMLGAAMNRMAEHLDESQRALADSRRQLSESLEKYRLLAEDAMDIVYSMDGEGRYSYVNAAMQQLAGYRPDEMIGHHFTEFLADESIAASLEEFERRARGEDVADTTEIEYVAKDGRRVPLELRGSTIMRDGRIVGMQGIARDMTRRYAMEAQIRELAEQEHRRAEQLQEVARASRRITRLASLDELLPDVASLLHEVFGYERVSIFLLDGENQQASLRAAAGRFAGPIPMLLTLSLERGVIGWVATHGEVLRIDDVQTEPRYLPAPATLGTCSELAVPIGSAGGVLGVLDVQSTKHRCFDASDEATIVILADQIATAIHNARLFDQQHSLAVAEERNRLAREIHDTIAQGLTAITLQLEVADALLDSRPEQVRPKIAKALELTRANLDEARRSVMDLRAAPLQEQTLSAALEQLVSTFRREQGIAAEFGARDVAGRQPAQVEAGLYRIAQEALNNVAKHAGAERVRVTLERVATPTGEVRGPSLVLTIEDDGSGFDPQSRPMDRRKGGFGLIGMQERARLLGGSLQVDTTPGTGTRIVVKVPAPARPERAEVADGKSRI